MERLPAAWGRSINYVPLAKMGGIGKNPYLATISQRDIINASSLACLLESGGGASSTHVVGSYVCWTSPSTLLPLARTSSEIQIFFIF